MLGSSSTSYRFTRRSGFLLLCLIQAVQTVYACWLNALYYLRDPPFFDSMEYTLSYAHLLAQARERGILATLPAAFHSGTVSLPWIFTVLLSPVLPYSRFAGIWFQEIWMTVLACSVFYYLVRYRGLTPLVGFCYTLPFVCFRAVYAANGGVSDFRMDLLLYVFMGCVGVWYLATYRTESRVPWVLSGVFVLLAILNRATAPVYLLVTFGPVLAARVLQGDLPALRRVVVFWLPPALLGVVALASNYEALHYYYFVWGADPNANLPLWKAAFHVVLAGWNIGVPLTLVCVPALYVGLRRARPGELDWKVLWIGTAPVLMLVLRGAGFNPFASMPTVFGWLLFSLLPVEGSPGFSEKGRSRLAWLLAAACAVNAVWAIRLHANPPGVSPAMAGIRAAIERMHAETVRRGERVARFATPYMGDVEESAIRNVLVFEYGAVPRGESYPYGGVEFRAPDGGVFTAPVPLNWAENVQGRNDGEKFAWLVALAEAKVDYMLVPDEPSIRWLEKYHPERHMNTRVREYKRRLLATGRWVQLGPPIVASPEETVLVLRKQ